MRVRPEVMPPTRDTAPVPAEPPRRPRKPRLFKRVKLWFRAFRKARIVAERVQTLEARLDHLTALADRDRERLRELGESPWATGDQETPAAVAAHVETQIAACETALRRDFFGRLAALADASADERAELSRAYVDLGRRLDLIRYGHLSPPPAPPETDGVDALLDSFYNRLERRFRGSREDIGRRVGIYLPDADAAHAHTAKPVLDLGCGRGEWLEVLMGRGLPAEGVDLNPVQIAEARQAGVVVREGDACAVLAAAPSGSYGMITAFHLVEHLPFRTVTWLVREAMRVLAPGGILLLETPHAGNLLVGGSSFHMDPTHVRPLPREVLTVLFDVVGFHPVETRLLHPHEKYEAMLREEALDPDLAGLLFGPQDLAVLGVKPMAPPR